jgi:hypothetical protein
MWLSRRRNLPTGPKRACGIFPHDIFKVGWPSPLYPSRPVTPSPRRPLSYCRGRRGEAPFLAGAPTRSTRAGVDAPRVHPPVRTRLGPRAASQSRASASATDPLGPLSPAQLNTPPCTWPASPAAVHLTAPAPPHPRHVAGAASHRRAPKRDTSGLEPEGRVLGTPPM